MMAEKPFHFDPEKNYDEQTLAQQSEIEKEIAQSQALISKRVSFDEFSAEYSEEDQIYLHKIQDLKHRFSCVRKVRGDGNCFYRAFGFRYFETLIEDKADFKRFQDTAQKTRDELVKLGFPEFTIDDFHENFMDVVQKLETCTVDDLEQTFNDQGLSDYLVVYLRLVVSGHLQKEADFFSNFIEGERGIKEFCNQPKDTDFFSSNFIEGERGIIEFCNQEVEPMGKESDHIQIIALTSALGVPVRVEYMDRGEGDKCNHHHFPEDSSPVVTLLYRPGHYDILYT